MLSCMCGCWCQFYWGTEKSIKLKSRLHSLGHFVGLKLARSLNSRHKRLLLLQKVTVPVTVMFVGNSRMCCLGLSDIAT